MVIISVLYNNRPSKYCCKYVCRLLYNVHCILVFVQLVSVSS